MHNSYLIFLHGFPFDSSTWNPQIEHFQNYYFTAAEDLRGLGLGKTGPAPWMLNHYVEDLKSSLDQKGIAKAVLCGVSMGGYVALNFYLRYPERVEALVLSNTQAAADSNEEKDKRFATIQKFQQEGLTEFADSFSKSVLCVNTLNRNPHLQKKIEALILRQKLENLALVLGALASRKDLSGELYKISCPTLVITGTDDKIIPSAVCDSLAKSIPEAHFERIKGAGHLPNLERPEKFNQILDTFLGALKGNFQNEARPYNYQQISFSPASQIFRK
jgi:3-oxoadipate enol-lactonase